MKGRASGGYTHTSFPTGVHLKGSYPSIAPITPSEKKGEFNSIITCVWPPNRTSLFTAPMHTSFHIMHRWHRVTTQQERCKHGASGQSPLGDRRAASLSPTYRPSLSLRMSNFLFSLSVTPSPRAIAAKVLMSTCFSGGAQLHGRPAKYNRIAVLFVQSKKQFLHTLA